MSNPIPYDPELEEPEKNEHETSEKLREVLRTIMTTTAKDCGRGLRSVHAKSHAILEGKFKVLGNLPKPLAQGLFKQPGEYLVVLRISTIPGDILDDHISVPRGLAMKVMNVEGERLAGSEGDRTQDFILVNAPAFAASKASKFLGNLKLLAKTTDKAEWAKKALSAVMRNLEKGLEAVGTKSPLITTLGGHPMTNPVGDAYFSQTPFRYGAYVCKFGLFPVSANLKALTDVVIDMGDRRDGLREELTKVFAHQSATWDFRVQLLTDTRKMPIEDSSVEWPQSDSPYVTVATMSVNPQTAWTESRAKVGDDQLAFSPWHGLSAHRPLGSINRVRKEAYAMSAEFRSQINGCPIHEPTDAVKLPE